MHKFTACFQDRLLLPTFVSFFSCNVTTKHQSCKYQYLMIMWLMPAKHFRDKKCCINLNVGYLLLALSQLDTEGLRTSSLYVERQVPDTFDMGCKIATPNLLSSMTVFSFTSTCFGSSHYRNICMVMSIHLKPQNILVRLKPGLGTLGQLIKMS